MSAIHQTIPIEELLAHASWMQSLAKRLVADDAEDLVQETWHAALTRPPDQRGPVRPWLGRVMRNALHMRRRGGARRSEREKAVHSERPEPSPPPDNLVARAQIHQTLAELVLALGDPHRSTLLLHFYEGWSIAEIARKQGIAATTVRSRVQAATERLRSQLDDRYESRAAWRAALVPALAVPAAPASAATGALVWGLVGLALVILVVLMTRMSESESVPVLPPVPPNTPVTLALAMEPVVGQPDAGMVKERAPAIAAEALPPKTSRKRKAKGQSALALRVEKLMTRACACKTSSCAQRTMNELTALDSPALEPVDLELGPLMPLVKRGIQCLHDLDAAFPKSQVSGVRSDFLLVLEDLRSAVYQCHATVSGEGPDEISGTLGLSILFENYEGIGQRISEVEIDEEATTIASPKLRRCALENIYLAEQAIESAEERGEPLAQGSVQVNSSYHLPPPANPEPIRWPGGSLANAIDESKSAVP